MTDREQTFDERPKDVSDANFYVIVPTVTMATAERVMAEVGSYFDCHIISAASVDQEAPILGSA